MIARHPHLRIDNTDRSPEDVATEVLAWIGTPSSLPVVTSSSDSANLFRLLLDTRSWLALDIDVDGRVLAGYDDLGSLQLVEIAADGVRTPLTNLPSKCRGRYVPGRRQVVVEHDQGGDENYQLSLLDVSALPTTPVGLDELEPLVRDEGHMNTLLDVTETSVVYSTNRRNEVDMDVVVRDLATGEERVVYDGGGYVAGSQVSHDEKAVAVTMISLQPSSTADRAGRRHRFVGGDRRRRAGRPSRRRLDLR